jgi:hypothetical protein
MVAPIKREHLNKTVLGFILCCAPLGIVQAQLAGTPGSFSRMGFGARGMGMGNALTAVVSHDLTSYYNPALPSFAQSRSASATYGFLSLDRRLGFVNYTQAIRPTAGLSAGIIYAGIHDIDGRDSDGEHTDNYSTSEYQFFFAFSNKFTDQLSVGLAVKFFYNNLFPDATATTVGVDVGLIYRVTESLTLGAVIQDIDAKYRWDTSNLYGRSGTTTTDRFPLLRRVGIAYRLPVRGDDVSLGEVAIEIENNNQGTTLVRAGAEIVATEYLTLRGGIDRMQTTKNDNGVKPSLGFTIRKGLDGLSPALSYAYIFEPFSTSGMNILSLTFSF